jgi:hypothetical protein
MTIADKRKQYAADNVRAARIIATNPAKHGGFGSLAVQWALAVLRRQTVQRERAA